MRTRILGIDPGSRLTGFGIIEIESRRIVYVASGCIRTQETGLDGRLREIFEGVGEVLKEYRPEVMAIETVFVRHNVASALKLGQARGAAICAVATRGVPCHEYSPTQIKQAVVGRGNAAKAQVQHMIRSLLALPSMPQADACDALACALCHAHHWQTHETLSGATPNGGRR